MSHKEHTRSQINFCNLTASLSKHHLIVWSHTLIQPKVLTEVTKSLYKTELPINSSYTSYTTGNTTPRNYSYLCNALMYATANNKAEAKAGASWEVLKKLKASGFHKHIFYRSFEVFLNCSKKTNKMAYFLVTPCFQIPLRIGRFLSTNISVTSMEEQPVFFYLLYQQHNSPRCKPFNNSAGYKKVGKKCIYKGQRRNSPSTFELKLNSSCPSYTHFLTKLVVKTKFQAD